MHSCMGISEPCWAAFSCLSFSTRVQHSLVESSTSGGKVRGGLSEVEIKPSGWHRIRLSCLSCCTTATAELEIFVFTQSLKGAREQCCAIKHCVCFLLYTQDFSFITLCFVSILASVIFLQGSLERLERGWMLILCLVLFLNRREELMLV